MQGMYATEKRIEEEAKCSLQMRVHHRFIGSSTFSGTTKQSKECPFLGKTRLFELGEQSIKAQGKLEFAIPTVI